MNDQELEDAFQALIADFQDPGSHYKAVTTSKNNLKISKAKDSNRPAIYKFRGDKVVDQHIDELKLCCVFLDDDSNIPLKLDPQCKDFKLLEKIEGDGLEKSWKVWARFGVGFPIQDRDFLMIQAMKTIPRPEEEGGDFVVIIYKSYEDETNVSYPGCVRGDTLSGYVLEQDGDKTKVCYIVQLDPKGWIPTWVVNFVGNEQPLYVDHIDKYMEENYGEFCKLMGLKGKKNMSSASSSETLL